MLLRNTVVVIVVGLAIGAAAWLSPRPASAATDLTGSWTFDWNGAPGPYPIPCTSAAAKQHGMDAYFYFTCPPGRVFSGTYNKGTGALTVTTTLLCKGFIETPLTLTATVSLDGNSMSGTWSTICIYPINGTFSADRSGPATVTFTPPATSTATPSPTIPSPAVSTPSQTPTGTPAPPPVGGTSYDVSTAGDRGFALPLVVTLAGLVGSAACAGVWYARRRA